MTSIVNENVCVIGGAGFLGSHLVRHLKDRSCNVLVLDNLITGKVKHLPRGVEFMWHDIRYDELKLVKTLRDKEIKYVFNYAAEPYIPECFERPKHFFEINAVAVLNVLECCNEAGVRGLLQVSSAEIYGDMTGKISEMDPVEPHSTYGASKLAADNLCQVRAREAGTPVVVLRQFNCVGERETHEYVIPEIISQLSNIKPSGKPIVHLGNDTHRDFLYAGDAVRMAVELLEKGIPGEVYNMGSEDVITIYNLARMISDKMGFTQSLKIVADEKRKRPWEIWHLQSENTKLYNTIGRRKLMSLESALERTINWYVDNDKKWGFEK